MKMRAVCFPLSLVATALLVTSVLGQTTQRPDTGEIEEQKRNRLYEEFVDTFRKNPASAYITAKEYLEKCAEVNNRTNFVRKWVNLYERELKKWHVKRLIQEGKFDEAFEQGRAMLVIDPNDLDTLYTLVEGGLVAFTNGNKAVIPEAIKSARSALQLIEAAPSNYLKKDDAVGWLNFSLGIFLLTSSPTEAMAHFRKFAQCEACRNDPYMYSRFADAVWRAEYYPLVKEFNSRFKTPQQKATPEAESLKLRLFWATDLIVDALARAIALAGSNARFGDEKASWMLMLKDLYKFRNSGYETGLSDFIEEVLEEPFPRQPI